MEDDNGIDSNSNATEVEIQMVQSKTPTRTEDEDDQCKLNHGYCSDETVDTKYPNSTHLDVSDNKTANNNSSNNINAGPDSRTEECKISDLNGVDMSDGCGNGHTKSSLNKFKETEGTALESLEDEDTGRSSVLCCKKPAEKTEVEKVGFFQLFRYADKLDVFLMLAGTLFMICTGAVVPANLYFFGDLLTRMVTFDTPTDGLNFTNDTETLSQCSLDRMSRMSSEGVSTKEDILQLVVNKYVVGFVSIGAGMLLASYLGMSLWVWTGERQIRRIRTAYFSAVMKQSIGFFDLHESGELNSRLVEDVSRLEDGFGDKMATFVQWLSTFVGAYLIGFISSWKLTLAVIAMCPILVIVAASLGHFMRTLVRRELQAYAKAGAVAEETFSSIRTVAAFGGEKEAEKRYSTSLQEVLKEGVRKAVVSGATGGMFWFIIFSIFALTFWYGAKLIREDCLNPGAILQVFIGVMMGSVNLGNATTVLENFANARAAAAALFKSIDAEVDIDSSSEEGLKPDSLEGNIEFVDVEFTYPARKDVQVLKGLNLKVKKGETVALVGESGCGKSTTIQLLQRFYKCAAGKIVIDGKDLKEYNITWLRNYMGIVSQEPLLFATTIAENIRLGGKWGDEITQEQVEVAAKEANCYDFITSLPQGFETVVGDRGTQLSGGQKQRIAIARALVRNPAILLLDEATSALDTQSEAVVQDALDKASQGRTTIVIAHRLSTVKGANKIIAFKEGKAHEEGTHDELMLRRGLYYTLVMQQLQRQEEEEKEIKKQALLRTLSNGSSNISSIPLHTETPTSPIHLEVPYNSSLHQPSSPTLSTHQLSPSLRRSKRMGSARSLRSTGTEAYGFGSVPFSSPQDEFQLDDEMVVEDDQIDGEPEISVAEILKMNKPEWYLIVIGSIAAILTGTIQPAFALLMSQILGALSEPSAEVQKQKVLQYVGYIMMVAVLAALATLLQNGLFALSGERLTVRLRKQSFAAIVKQEISYFDEDINGIGYLTNRLSSQAALVKGATGARIGIMVQVSATILAALGISFGYVWELTLAVLAVLPIVVAAGKIQHRLIAGHSATNKKSNEEGGHMAQEAISNMRTVTSLNRQRYFEDKFSQHYKMLYKRDLKQAFTYGIAYGISQGMLPFMFAICFGFGSYLVVCDCLPWRSGRIPFFHIFRVFAATTFGSMAIGRATSQLPDFGKAKVAAYNIKKLLERVSAIDPTSSTGEQLSSCEGQVKFTDVKFHYPSRTTVPVLQGLNFTIKKGETLALVGSSGCGKSTSVSLLERFYDVIGGTVLIDGVDVQKLNVKWLRKNLGLVSQEPTLFDASIAYNIAYGDNDRQVTMTEIIEAATKANAHSFIASLPQGYDTNVGAKGTQLSGGQKQRIAIARALVRNPAILLLDEATSALDVHSEKIVQDALETAMDGRTAIIIAHRLSTIRNADKIGVLDNGKIVELGTHDELITTNGYYYNLINGQL